MGLSAKDTRVLNSNPVGLQAISIVGASVALLMFSATGAAAFNQQAIDQAHHVATCWHLLWTDSARHKAECSPYNYNLQPEWPPDNATPAAPVTPAPPIVPAPAAVVVPDVVVPVVETPPVVEPEGDPEGDPEECEGQDCPQKEQQPA